MAMRSLTATQRTFLKIGASGFRQECPAGSARASHFSDARAPLRRLPARLDWLALPFFGNLLRVAVKLLICTGIAFAQPMPDPQQIPDDMRQGIAQGLSGPFVIFRNGVFEELKLSTGQRSRLLKQSDAYF